MIVGSAPLRVSLLGGGTDVPSFFKNHEGAVLGGSINSRVYVCVVNMVETAEYPFRFTYRTVDNANTKLQITHPVWKTLLMSRSDITRVNAATFSDIPGNSGLGSSSSFTVAAISALDLHLGQEIDNERIAKEAIRVERHDLAEPGGWQDQLHATYGGFRLYTFKGGSFVVGQDLLGLKDRESLNKSSILVRIGESRSSSTFHSPASDPISKQAERDLEFQAELAVTGARILSGASDWSSKFDSICQLMNENWKIKSSVSNRSSTGINDLISFGLKNGAKSAKLCGAGGSGYVLFLGESEGLRNLANKVDSKTVLKFEFDTLGAKSVYV